MAIQAKAHVLLLACLSWCQVPSGTRDQIFVTVNCAVAPLTGGWMCHLQLLLALASTIILVPEFCRICQILIQF
jgi:hypothetical protein